MATVNDVHVSSYQQAVIDEDTTLLSRLLCSNSHHDAHLVIDDEGTTILHLSSNCASPSVAQLLLDHGADVNWQNEDGFTALHVAALWGKDEIVQVLLNSGADSSICDSDGLSPLDYAKRQGHAMCVAVLEKSSGATQQKRKRHYSSPSKKYLDVSPSVIQQQSDSSVSFDTVLERDYTCLSPNNTISQSMCFARKKLNYTLDGLDLQSDINCHNDSPDVGEETVMVEDQSKGGDYSQLYITALDHSHVEEDSNSHLHGNQCDHVLHDFSNLRICDEDNHSHEMPQHIFSERLLDQQDTTHTAVLETSLECSFASNIAVAVPTHLQKMSNSELRDRLVAAGVNPGPITDTTRTAYLVHLAKLDSGLPSFNDNVVGNKGYKYELVQVLKGSSPIPDLTSLEMEVFRQPPQSPYIPIPNSPSLLQHSSIGQSSHLTPSRSSTPDTPISTPVTKCNSTSQSSSTTKEHKLTKDKFNYLLLDPRMLERLDDCSTILERFNVFVRSVFYVGKGKNARSMQHLKDAKRLDKSKVSEKESYIQDIWSSGYGIVSLQVFHNITSEEAFTREACIIDALGLENLTNIQRGHVHGEVSSWPVSRRRLFGVHLLYKSLQIYLVHKPQQIYSFDL